MRTERGVPKEGAREAFTKDLRVLNKEGGEFIRNLGARNVEKMMSVRGIPGGVVMIFSRTGMLEAYQMVGSASPLNVTVATEKSKTTLAMKRSSRKQRERMEELGQSREDFGDQIKSLLAGAVAIFTDKDLNEFVGVGVFSGAAEKEDETIMVGAIEDAGFYTDIEPESESREILRDVLEKTA